MPDHCADLRPLAIRYSIKCRRCWAQMVTSGHTPHVFAAVLTCLAEGQARSREFLRKNLHAELVRHVRSCHGDAPAAFRRRSHGVFGAGQIVPGWQTCLCGRVLLGVAASLCFWCSQRRDSTSSGSQRHLQAVSWTNLFPISHVCLIYQNCMPDLADLLSTVDLQISAIADGLHVQESERERIAIHSTRKVDPGPREGPCVQQPAVD